MRPYTRDRSFTSESLPTLNSYGATTHIQRYDGVNKIRQSWDGLRKDDELWSKDGDCVVHFYAPRTSRRGPSLRVPLQAIEQTRSTYLLQECLFKADPTSPTISDDSDNSDSGYGGSQSSGGQLRCSELYIPAPAYATRKEAHLYHLGTRNYFAYLLDAPLVGETLGVALTELWRRIQEWQPDDIAASDFKIYCQEQGYLSYAENPDYALASLYLAEQTRRKEFWTDAFVNCVGMYNRLEQSEEIAGVSSKTMLLVDRAAQELGVHIQRMTQSLGSFLEDDLGQVGLSKALRDHLDRFRSTLHSFYVHQINGYFPPDKNRPWDSRLWQGMHEDFQCLYEYLADYKSSDDRTNSRGALGGICVMQNLQAFNERHEFVPLAHPLPLLPDQSVAQSRPTERRRSFGAFSISRAGIPVEQKSNPRQLLAKATNTDDASVLENRLVQEYMRFERIKMEEKTTIAEARKVRWLLVYSALQMLISITQVPSDVRTTSGLSYPVCVSESGLAIPPWIEDELIWQSPVNGEAQSPVELDAAPSDYDSYSIRPDCEAESAGQYFSVHNSIIRTDSEMSLASMSSSPLRKTSTISRTASIRSSVGSLHRSVVGSLSRRSSQRRPSFTAPTRKAIPVCETLVELQGNDDDSLDESPTSNSASPEEQVQVTVPNESAQDTSDAPTLEMHQLSIAGEDHASGCARPYRPQIQQPAWSSSPNLIENLASELSRVDSFSERMSSQPDLAQFNFEIAASSPPEKLRLPPAHNATKYAASKRNKGINVHAGRYIPGGSIKSPYQHIAGTESPCSGDSCASSVYSDNGGQAAEIEEEECRGRRRIRRHSDFGAIDEQINLGDDFSNGKE